MDTTMQAIIIHDTFGFGNYYLYLNGCSLDCGIAELLNLDTDEYRNHLQNKFNGHIGIANEIYFHNKQDALNSAEWVDSIIMLNVLEKYNEKS